MHILYHPNSCMHSFREGNEQRADARTTFPPIHYKFLAEMVRDNLRGTTKYMRECLQNDGGLFVAISPVPTFADFGVFLVDDFLRPDGHVDYVWCICLETAFW
jgi:hypothetical protein